FVRRHVTGDVVTGNDVVVPQARQRTRATHLDHDERISRIDTEHRPALRCSLAIELVGEPGWRGSFGAGRNLRRVLCAGAKQQHAGRPKRIESFTCGHQDALTSFTLNLTFTSAPMVSVAAHSPIPMPNAPRLTVNSPSIEALLALLVSVKGTSTG